MYRSKTLQSELQLSLPLYNDIAYDVEEAVDSACLDPEFESDFELSLFVYDQDPLPTPDVSPIKESRKLDTEHEYRFDALTQDQAELAHRIMLERSLMQLFNARSSKDLVVEVLCWINYPLRQGRNIPFSFHTCAILSGLDPERLQTAANEKLVRNRPDFQ